MKLSDKDKNQLINYIQHANFFVSNYNNSIAKIPQILITTENLKASMNNIRSGLIKITRFIEREKNFNDLEQLYKSVNIQFIFLIEIMQIHFTKEYTGIHNEVNNFNFSKLNEIFDQKNEQKFIRALEIKKKRLKAFIWRILISHQLILKTAKLLSININQQDYLEIIKEISFPKEYNQIGINILNYFGEIIHSKYQDEDISISIQQLKSKIILVIKTPENYIEIIEKDFHDYGEVILGQKIPRDYLKDNNQIIKLEHQLRIIELELHFTKELLLNEKEKNNNLEYFKNELKKATTTINIQNLHTGENTMTISNNTNTNIIGNNTGNNNEIEIKDISINTKLPLKEVNELISTLTTVLKQDNLNIDDQKLLNSLKKDFELTEEELKTEKPDEKLINKYWKSIKSTMKTFTNLSSYSKKIIENIDFIEKNLSQLL